MTIFLELELEFTIESIDIPMISPFHQQVRLVRPPSSVTGWWLSPTPLKNDGVNVSWDDEIPN